MAFDDTVGDLDFLYCFYVMFYRPEYEVSASCLVALLNDFIYSRAPVLTDLVSAVYRGPKNIGKLQK
jgi:hypothetical protein